MPVTLQMVDVFGRGPFSGNPLAVIAGADGLSTQEMQRITRWFNLSEAAFVLPPTQPQAQYRVRIFTLDREMPFAGHPTLGACHAWLAGRDWPEGPVVQECGAGLVAIRREPGRLAFAAPPLIRCGAPSPAELDQVLRFLVPAASDIQEAAWIDNGPGWLGIRLASAQQVLSLEVAGRWPRRLDVGVIGPHAPGAEAAFEVRAFFTDHLGAVVEDPVTGSLNAGFAQWLFARGLVRDEYVAAQGTRLQRQGRIYLSRDGAGQVWVGGATRTQVIGQLPGL